MNPVRNYKYQKSIMRRVYAVWFLKKITNPVFVKLYIFIFLMWQLMLQVSITNVIQNMPLYNFSKSINFLVKATLGTEVFVQIALLLATAISIFMIRDVFKRESYLEIA